jgi:hypothetical protein
MSDPDADWPFDQAPNVAALTVRAILEGAPILYVSHDADDDGWQFLDGQPVDIDDGRVIGMRQALVLDPSLRSIADLPPGWIAWRKSRADPWVREPHPVEPTGR